MQHLIELIHQYHDKCEDQMEAGNIQRAMAWLEAADDAVEALGKLLLLTEGAEEVEIEMGVVGVDGTGIPNGFWVGTHPTETTHLKAENTQLRATIATYEKSATEALVELTNIQRYVDTLSQEYGDNIKKAYHLGYREGSGLWM